MGEISTDTPLAAARSMLDIFASVGAEQTDNHDWLDAQTARKATRGVERQPQQPLRYRPAEHSRR